MRAAAVWWRRPLRSLNRPRWSGGGGSWRREEGARVVRVPPDAGAAPPATNRPVASSWQFVQQLDAHAAAPVRQGGRPFSAVPLQAEHASRCRPPSGARPGWPRHPAASARPCTCTAKTPSAAGRRGREAQVQRRRSRAPILRPSLRPCTTGRDAVGRPSSAAARHVAAGQRFAHGRADTRRPCTRSSSCAPRRSRFGAGGVEHGVVAGALGAEAEIVAHQHVARAQAAHQHVVDEGSCGDCEAKAASKRMTTAWSMPQRSSSDELVAQRGDAPRRDLGVPARAAKKSRGCGSKRARSWHAAVARFVGQQRQHIPVAAVHAVEVSACGPPLHRHWLEAQIGWQHRAALELALGAALLTRLPAAATMRFDLVVLPR